jgi:hypothetical protein
VDGRQEELLRADALHLLAHDARRALGDAPAQGEERVNPSAELAYVARAQEQTVRDDLRVGGVFAQGWDEVL